MKRTISIAIILSMTVFVTPSLSEAGPLKWIVDWSKSTFKGSARRTTKETTRREIVDEVRITQSLMNKAVTIGSYTFTGVMIIGVLKDSGLTENPIPEAQAEVNNEVIQSAAKGDASYTIRYCIDPSNNDKFAIPQNWNGCPNDNMLLSTSELALNQIRELASHG